MKEKDEICCQECGGTKISGRFNAWFYLDKEGNADDMIDFEDYCDQYYCYECQKNDIELSTKGTSVVYKTKLREGRINKILN